MKKYYMLAQEGSQADITIYGDITSWPWMESDVSAYLLSKQIEGIEAEVINVYINSYGGEVAEGLAIYNALKRHSASVRTYCDGFACSAASVIFMAGDVRIMGEASLLMIHNAWSYAAGNAAQLRKQADDLETISAAAANAYKASVSISGEKLAELLDNETWIAPEDAVSMGFATDVEHSRKSDAPAASARLSVMAALQRKPEGVTVNNATIADGATVEQVAKAVAEQLRAMAATEPPAAEQNQIHKFIMALGRQGGTT